VSPVAKPDKAVMEAVTKQIAGLALNGQTVPQIAAALNLGQGLVRKTMQSKEFKELMKEFGDEAVVTARNMLRARVEKLAPEAWEAVERLIRGDKGRDVAEGLKMYFRLIGLDKVEEDKGMGDIIIQLPGIKPEKIIEVPKEGEEDDSI
jgi:hypothetical protein